MKNLEEDGEIPSNTTVSSGVTSGGPGSLDLPIGATRKKKNVSVSLLARRKYKPSSLSESELSTLSDVDYLSCPQYGIFEIKI